MNLLDYVIAAALLFFGYRGFNKGAFATLSSFVGKLISLAGAYMFREDLMKLLNEKINLSQKVTPLVSQWVSIPTEAVSKAVSQKAVDSTTGQLTQLELPEFIKKPILEQVNHILIEPVSQGINNMGQGLVSAVTSFLLNAISFVLIFVILAFAFQYLLPAIFKAVRPRSLAFVDRLGGALLGSLIGVIFVVVAVVILSPVTFVAALQGEPGVVGGMMKGSLLLNYLFEYAKLML